MRYALLIFDKPGSYDPLGDDERKAVTAEYMEIAKDPRIVGGAQLRPADTATTGRQDGGEVLTTDGPLADTKEVFGGCFLVEADDVDPGVEVARRIPAVRLGGSVEVRRITEQPS